MCGAGADRLSRLDEVQRHRGDSRRQRSTIVLCGPSTGMPLYRDGQKDMLLVNLFLSSHCSVDKDILPADIMKLRVYVGQLSDKLDPKATDKQY